MGCKASANGCLLLQVEREVGKEGEGGEKMSLSSFTLLTILVQSIFLSVIDSDLSPVILLPAVSRFGSGGSNQDRPLQGKKLN